MSDDEIIPLLNFNDDDDNEVVEVTQGEGHQHQDVTANVIITNKDISQEHTAVKTRNTDISQDHTADFVDEPINIQQVLLETKRRRDELCAKGPRLPEGKEVHLFVSYSSGDCDRVLPIIVELERAYGVSCILADRDFHSGKKILENIDEGMEKSVKVLLFLSNNFIQSGYCKHEHELAFVTSLENGENIIIPVLLEDCEIPSTLKTLTYIDAQKEQDTLAQRIVDDFNNADRTNDVLPLHFSRAPQRLENGYFIDIKSKQDTSCIGRPVVKYIDIDPNVKKRIKDCKIQLSDALLEQVVLVINHHYATHFSVKVDNCYPCCFGFATLWIFIVFAYFTATEHMYDQIDVRIPSQKGVEVYDLFLAWNGILLVLVLLAFALGMMCCCYCFRHCCRKRAHLNLDKNLFKFFISAAYAENVLFSVWRVNQGCCGEREQMSLRLIRYNFKPCETYLANKMKTLQECQVSNFSPEEKSKELIVSCLRLFLLTHGGNMSSLPDAPENRHNVKGGKKCFCQMLEDELQLMTPEVVVV